MSDADILFWVRTLVAVCGWLGGFFIGYERGRIGEIERQRRVDADHRATSEREDAIRRANDRVWRDRIAQREQPK